MTFNFSLLTWAAKLGLDLEYAKATPLKLAVSCAIGVVFGFFGGVLGLLMHGRVYRPSM